MARSLDEFIATLPRSERARIKARAKELVADELSLREIRQALGATQTKLSRKLRIGQHAISRLETRADMRLSSLRNYLRALGGDLELVARFPNRPAIKIEPRAQQIARSARARRRSA
jgi:transcriptional regulator with XRE-family HTH domain